MLSLGLNGLRGSSSSPTFGGTLTALSFSVTGTTAGQGLSLANDVNRVSWPGGAFLDGSNGIRSASRFQSDVGSGGNAFLMAAGARLKFSVGGTTDYFSGNGTTKITAAGSFGVVGDFDVNGGFSVSSGTPGVIRYSPIGTRFINMQDAAGINYSAGTGFKHVFSNEVKFSPRAEPAGPSEIGDMYMTTAGVLKVCTAAGTPGTWVSVGAQV